MEITDAVKMNKIPIDAIDKKDVFWDFLMQLIKQFLEARMNECQDAEQLAAELALEIRAKYDLKRTNTLPVLSFNRQLIPHEGMELDDMVTGRKIVFYRGEWRDKPKGLYDDD